MVARVLLAVALLALSGCAGNRYVEHPITAWFTAPEAAPAAPPDAQGHCRALARQRMHDASFQGEDETTQREVYRRTYADCRSWEASHG